MQNSLLGKESHGGDFKTWRISSRGRHHDGRRCRFFVVEGNKIKLDFIIFMISMGPRTQVGQRQNSHSLSLLAVIVSSAPSAYYLSRSLLSIIYYIQARGRSEFKHFFRSLFPGSNFAATGRPRACQIAQSRPLQFPKGPKPLPHPLVLTLVPYSWNS